MTRDQLELLREYVQAEISNVIKLNEFQDWSYGHEPFEKLVGAFEKAPELSPAAIQLSDEQIAARAVEALVQRIDAGLQVKTGWGRNEVMKLVMDSAAAVLRGNIRPPTPPAPPAPPAPPPARTGMPTAREERREAILKRRAPNGDLPWEV